MFWIPGAATESTTDPNATVALNVFSHPIRMDDFYRSWSFPTTATGSRVHVDSLPATAGEIGLIGGDRNRRDGRKSIDHLLSGVSIGDVRIHAVVELLTIE